MPFLAQSNEWRLVSELGRLFGQRKTRHQVQQLGRHEPVYHPTIEHIEVELRGLLISQDIPHNLNDAEFKECQAALSKLCLLLEDLASTQLSASGSTAGAAPYPRLRALLRFLDSADGPVDLVHGSNTTLFTLPRDVDGLHDCLRIVTECCRALSKLFAPPASEPATQPFRMAKKNKDAWKKARIRKQAAFALETLFKHFKCGTAHEVLLRLTEDTGEDAALPTLQMMLLKCPELESWVEARCESLHLNDMSISPIPDMCMGLPESPSQGAALVLYMEHHALFGAWQDSKLPAARSSMESLSQLITKGVFEPPSRNINAVLNGLSITRFSTIEKRALAVKLGFCLMDFFDAEVDSKHIYFLDSTRKESPPYLAFKSKLPVTPDPYNFRLGHPHPVLLSFAKLLLEIYCGQAINLDISSDDRQIQDAWTKLLDVVETLERDEQDSHLQAIRGCLLVHQEIAKAIGFRDIEAEVAEKKIRRKLYKEVVYKLQLGLAESTPRMKRRRSESPPPSTRFDDSGSVKSLDTSLRPIKPGFDFPQIKRQRTPDSINSLAEGSGNTGHYSIGRRQSSLADAENYPPASRDEFKIAIFCALGIEYDAVSLLVDEFWDEKTLCFDGSAPGDANRYKLGRIGRANVVLVLLSNMGKASAASSATSLTMSYRELQVIILTGICGGVPQSSTGQELLLGDVVVSKGIIQYDLGRRFPGHFAMKDSLEDVLSRPKKNIRNMLAFLQTDLERESVEERTALLLRQLQQKNPKYQYPGADKDRLFEAGFRHKHRAPLLPESLCLCNDSAAACEESRTMSCQELGCPDNIQHLVSRERLKPRRYVEHDSRRGDAHSPSIFVGLFGSGDTVLKSGEDRDQMANKYDIMAFEMEAAGVWDTNPCIVVKGVCDYADSHKNKSWQAFASATAASAAKALIERYMQGSSYLS